MDKSLEQDIDEYTGVNAQSDPEFFLEGYSLQEINELTEHQLESKQ